MARTYNRDARGRFASGGGGAGSKGGGKKQGGAPAAKPAAAPRSGPKTTSARGRALANERRARAAARSATTDRERNRAARSLANAEVARAWYQSFGTGKKRSPNRAVVGGKPAAKPARKAASKPRSSGSRRVKGPANGIRPVSFRLQAARQASLTPRQFLEQEDRNARRVAAGRKPSTESARNGIRRTGRPLKKPAANRIIRTPVTAKGRQAKLDWLRGRLAGIRGDIRDELRDVAAPLKRIKAEGDALTRRWARRRARDIAQSTGKGVMADVARSVVRAAPPQEVRAARAIIAGRARRAAAAAARGSKPAARAQAIYDRQLAPVLPKGRKVKAKNNYRPGPNNPTKPPKRRSRRKPKS